VNALQDPEYYAIRHWRTVELREQLACDLGDLGFEVLPGIASFLLCELPADGPDAASVVHECRQRGLFLRDAKLMGTRMGTHSIRIAVKDANTNQTMIRILREVLEALKP
jgi:histidinol-phosphate/aromatic aminotransferase/cobyric acid decarboxylase-like protein